MSSLEMSVGVEVGSETLLNPVQMHSTATDTSRAPAVETPQDSDLELAAPVTSGCPFSTLSCLLSQDEIFRGPKEGVVVHT